MHVDVKYYFNTSVKLHIFTYNCVAVKSEINNNLMWIVRTTVLAKNRLNCVVKYNHSYIRTNIEAIFRTIYTRLRSYL